MGSAANRAAADSILAQILARDENSRCCRRKSLASMGLARLHEQNASSLRLRPDWISSKGLQEGCAACHHVGSGSSNAGTMAIVELGATHHVMDNSARLTSVYPYSVQTQLVVGDLRVLTDHPQEILRGVLDNGLYRITLPSCHSSTPSASVASLTLWHNRFGHATTDQLVEKTIDHVQDVSSGFLDTAQSIFQIVADALKPGVEVTASLLQKAGEEAIKIASPALSEASKRAQEAMQSSGIDAQPVMRAAKVFSLHKFHSLYALSRPQLVT
ncbi:hypothetical protein NL676_025433 [Syzygium grande]|nr:hypothetical protein NL676_025433 [Syzygium grande]